MNLPTLLPAQSGLVRPQYGPVTDLGLDAGNGSLKFAVEGVSKSVLSGVRLVEPGEIDPPSEGGMVHYIDGDRPTLAGKTWVIGDCADTDGGIRLVDEPDRKPSYVLHLLLGTLAMLPYRSEWRLNIVASVHNRAMREAMKAALSGSHLVSFNAGDQTSVVRIDSARIVDEGAGAIALVPGASEGKSLLLDIGCGTIIGSHYGADLKRIGAEPRYGSGTEALFGLIANSAEFHGRFKERGNTRIIRSAIERGTFRYGTFNFQSIYAEKLPQWSEQHLKPLLSTVRNWRLASDRLVAVGGGCLLPGVGASLTAAGFVIPSDPVTANARGLLHLAQLVRG